MPPRPSCADRPAAALVAPQPPALLLAAGRGERMRPLTDTCPKPLLAVQGRPLLEWHLCALAAAGVPRAVVNTAWLGGQIRQRLGAAFSPPLPPGAQGATGQGAPAEIPRLFASQPLPVKGRQLLISYSNEADDFGHALETAGGIARALPQLAGVFWLAAGDVFAPDFTFDAAAAQHFAASSALAHLWLVPNPAHHPGGDFALGEDGLAFAPAAGSAVPRHTYSTLALLRAALFAPPWCDIAPGNPQGVAAPLAPLLRRAMQAGRVSAELYRGRWTDVGTPERLAVLNR